MLLKLLPRNLCFPAAAGQRRSFFLSFNLMSIPGPERSIWRQLHSKTLLLSRQETKYKATAFWLAECINSGSKLHGVNCFPNCWLNLQRMSWWAGHTNNKWSSSSTAPWEHRRQILSLLGTLSGFACRPHSTSKRWFEHLNLDKDCLRWPSIHAGHQNVSSLGWFCSIPTTSDFLAR